MSRSKSTGKPGLASPCEPSHVPCPVPGIGHGGNGHPRAAAGLRAQEHNPKRTPAAAGGGRDPHMAAEGRLPGWSEDVISCPVWAARGQRDPVLLESLVCADHGGTFLEGEDPQPHIGDLGEMAAEDPTLGT